MSYFQAFGVLKSKVIERNDSFFVNYDGKEFLLYVPNQIKFALRKELEVNSEALKLGVYPQYYLPKKLLTFVLVSFKDVRQPEDVLALDNGEFVLRGLPQFLPQLRDVRLPALSVYRNAKRADWDKLKAIHLPVNFKPFDVEIARFKKGEETKWTFLQAVFTLVVNDKVKGSFFQLKNVISPPSGDVPKYLKPPKREKAGNDKAENKPAGKPTNKPPKGKPTKVITVGTKAKKEETANADNSLATAKAGEPKDNTKPVIRKRKTS